MLCDVVLCVVCCVVCCMLCVVWCVVCGVVLCCVLCGVWCVWCGMCAVEHRKRVTMNLFDTGTAFGM